MACYGESVGVQSNRSEMFGNTISQTSFGLPHVEKVASITGDNIDKVLCCTGEFPTYLVIAFGPANLMFGGYPGAGLASRAVAWCGRSRFILLSSMLRVY